MRAPIIQPRLVVIRGPWETKAALKGSVARVSALIDTVVSNKSTFLFRRGTAESEAKEKSQAGLSIGYVQR